MDNNIVGWITRGGKRIPIRKGQGNAKSKSGWDKDDLYSNGKKVASVSENKIGKFDARYKSKQNDKGYLPNYETKEKAKSAAERSSGVSKKYKYSSTFTDTGKGIKRHTYQNTNDPGDTYSRTVKIRKKG